MQLNFVTVDVFTDRRFGGNPFAVVLNGDGLTTEQMQSVAAEFNLSETTFVLPPRDPSHTHTHTKYGYLRRALSCPLRATQILEQPSWWRLWEAVTNETSRITSFSRKRQGWSGWIWLRTEIPLWAPALQRHNLSR